MAETLREKLARIVDPKVTPTHPDLLLALKRVLQNLDAIDTETVLGGRCKCGAWDEPWCCYDPPRDY